MTPSRRSSIRPSINSTVKNTDEPKRRDVKLVRDKDYQQQCYEKVYNFLTEKEYDGNFNSKTLISPSVKDFQNIFKFIIEFINPNYEYSRIEEDVLTIIKALKYPYVNEINRSQLIAITPHTWPVILSMLSWLVEYITMVDDFDVEMDPGNIGKIFYEYTTDSYLKFMEGEDEVLVEQKLEEELQKLFKDGMNEIENKKKYIEELEEKCKEFGGDDEIERLKNKNKILIEDEKNVKRSESQLEEKIKKNEKIIQRIEKDYEEIQKESEELRIEYANLNEIVKNQEINPEDFKELNHEKINLLRELEKLKNEKEIISKVRNENKNEINENLGEIEKYKSDLISVLPEDKIEDIEHFTNNKKENVRELTDYKIVLQEKLEEITINNKEADEQLSYLKDKLYSSGKLYLEKKELSELEHRRIRKEKDELERECLKLYSDSNSGVIQSQQLLRKAEMEKVALENKIKNEKEELDTLICNFTIEFKNTCKRINDSKEEIEREYKNTGSK